MEYLSITCLPILHMWHIGVGSIFDSFCILLQANSDKQVFFFPALMTVATSCYRNNKELKLMFLFLSVFNKFISAGD